MKDVLNFALTMSGAPYVMTVLMSMMLMLFAVSLAILIMMPLQDCLLTLVLELAQF